MRYSGSIPRFVHARRGIQRAPRKHSSARDEVVRLACVWCSFSGRSQGRPRILGRARPAIVVSDVRSTTSVLRPRAVRRETSYQSRPPLRLCSGRTRKRPGPPDLRYHYCDVSRCRTPGQKEQAGPASGRNDGESRVVGTHIGEKLPRLWYIVEVDLYITSYVLHSTSGSPYASRVSAPGPSPAVTCVDQMSGAPRHRRDVVPVVASARWRGGSW